MDRNNLENRYLSQILPFSECSPFTIICDFLNAKDKLLERFRNNNFSKEIMKHICSISRANNVCDYYDEHNINEIFSNHQKNSLKVYHQNLSSFDLHKYELLTSLHCINFFFDVIMLTEVGRTTAEDIGNIFPNYEVFLDASRTKKGGAAILIIKNKFNSVIVSNNHNIQLSCDCSKCEIQNKWVEICTNNNKILVGCIYRHPRGNLDHFNEALTKSLKLVDNNSIGIVGGDINIDLIKNTIPTVDDYINACMENNFIHTITMPTRITDHSATLIDHLLIKLPLNLINTKTSSGILISDISDHLPCFLAIDVNTLSAKNRPFTRIFSKRKIDKFINEQSSEPPLLSEQITKRIDEIISSNNSQQMKESEYNNIFKQLIINLQSLRDKYFPLTRISKQKFKEKPYLTKGLKVSIRHKNRLFKNKLNNPNEINKYKWRKYRNLVTKLIRKRETEYYKSILADKNKKNRALWDTFGNILSTKKCSKRKIDKLTINEQEVTDETLITEEMNNFFSNIGKNLSNKLNQNLPDNNNNSTYQAYMDEAQTQSFYLFKTNESEVEKLLEKIKSEKSPGYDELSPKFIKLCTPLLSPILTKLFNLMTIIGTYPQEFKLAKVIPIHKSGDTTSINNYRPISILSCLNMLFEKLLYRRIYKYLVKYKILYKYQYGFRSGHSTIQALVEMTDQIKMAINNQEMFGGIFIDLTKAFDTVSHDILLGKMKKYGFRGITYKLFESYLNNRHQYVQVGKSKSQSRKVSYGVPQGSVLGPLLFLIFINDLPNCCPSGNTRIFADDTNIFLISKDIKELENKIKLVMCQLEKWLIINKLTLNTKKSSFTIFRSPRLKIENIPDKITFNNSEILRAKSVKYLGVTFDEFLNFKEHSSIVCNSLKKYFRIFYNIRRYINKQQVCTLYYSFIYSRIKYAITVYGANSEGNIKKIQTMQNKLLKVLVSKNNRYPTNQLHNELKLLKVRDIKDLETLTFVKNFTQNNLPPIFDNYFSKPNHRINTRGQNSLLVVPTHRNNFGKSAMRIIGAIKWNALELNLKALNKVKAFRRAWKETKLPYES